MTYLKKNCPPLAYADDVKLYKEILKKEDCKLLQYNINIINEWCKINSMSLNINKCQYITFTKKKNIINYDYSIDSIKLDKVSVVRDLGVWFDSSLSFKFHYKNIVAKASRMLGFVMRTAKPFKQLDTFKILYSSLVRSHLEYCSSVWTPIYKVDRDSIESIQRRFLRQLSIKLGLRKTLPEYEDRLAHYNFQGLVERRKIADMCLLHKVVNGLLSEELLININIMIPNISKRRPTRTLFSIPPSNNNVGGNNPLYRMCHSYNNLTTDVCNELDIFHQNSFNFKNAIFKLFN